MDNIILRCDNNINGIFTAIYDAFVYKNQMQKENHEVYRDNISIEIGIGGNYTLFSKMIDIETDEVKVQKTILTIQKKLGFKIYETVFDALCHYSDNRATIVLGFLVRAFKLTNREFHLQTGNLAYKTGFSFTKRESWVTKGILGLLFTKT